jgi:ABC-type uncharacterized transport system substrate-binding protein
MIRIIFILAVFSVFLSACALCGGGASLVNVSTNTVIQNSKLQKIEVVWKFDETISGLIIDKYDKNKNKKFDANEVQEIFTILSKNEKPNFMTVVSVDSSDKQSYKIDKFNAYIQNKCVFFTFDIVLDCPLGAKNKLFYYFLDSTGFLVFVHTPENIKIQNNSGYKIGKNIGFKVIQNTMSVANIVSLEIKK